MNKQVSFSTSLLFFWIKGFISVDTRFVKVSTGNTILGFIPAGRDNQSIPLKNISACMISSQVKIGQIIFGLLFAFFFMDGAGQGFLVNAIGIILGLVIAGNGIQNILIIQRAGNNYVLSVPFFEKAKLVSIQNDITEMLAEDTDKTDLNLFLDRKKTN